MTNARIVARIRVTVVNFVFTVIARIAFDAYASISIDSVLALAVIAVDVLTFVDVEIAIGPRDAGRTATIITGSVGRIELLTKER